MKEKKERKLKNIPFKIEMEFSIVTLVASLVTIAGFGLTNLLYTSSAMSQLEQRIERVRQESSQNYRSLKLKNR